MRLQALVTSAALALTMGFALTAPAEAGWFWRDRDPDAPDRYPYVYEAPRYYPYYNSDYWRPAWEMRRPRPYYVQPPYYPAWGYPLGCEADCGGGEAPLK